MEKCVMFLRRQKRSLRTHSWNLLVARSMMALCGLCLTLLLAACTNPFFTPTKSGAATPVPYGTPTTAATSPTPTYIPRTITLHVTNCPSNVAGLKWDQIAGTKANVNKVQLVTCGSLEGSGSLEAVVGVGYYTPDAKLDVYVYDGLTGTPTVTFKVLGLLDGDAQISPAGTLMTAEVGPKGIATTTNLFKEYKWNGSTFTQVMFPFLYPDMTHYQAEQDNALVTSQLTAGNKDQEWKTSCTGEGGHLASSIFRWSNTTSTVQTYDKGTDTVIVQIANSGPGGGGFVVTCHHLDGNTNSILEIASVTPLDTNMTVTAPASGVQVGSPVSVSGVSQAGAGVLDELVVYDDTFVRAGDSGPITRNGSGYVSFTNSVTYTLNASGVQEGIIVFFVSTQNNLALTNQILAVKVFLSA